MFPIYAGLSNWRPIPLQRRWRTGRTAGQPILRAIEGQDLDHVVVGVIRYWGGIKLGAGGLMRAYGGTAAEALRTAERQVESPRVGVVVEAGFEHISALYHALDVCSARIAPRIIATGR